MFRPLMRLCAGLLVVVLAACSSAPATDDGRMSYDDAVRKIGRPPTSSMSSPDGSLQATWETHTRDTTRQLILTFDKDRKLTGSRNATVPRARGRR